jgi:alpha-D-xyloside xylohydrolase
MKKNTIALGLSAGLLLASCAVKNYTKTDDGVFITLKPSTENQLRTLRLQVLGNDLIHVAATAQEFQKDSSLIIVPNQQTVPFHINQSKDSIQPKR